MKIETEHRERISGWLVIAAAVAVSIAVVDGNYTVVWFPTLFLGLLFLVSVLREVQLTVGNVTIGMNSDTAIIAGAIVIFHTLNSPLGFVLAMMATTVYMPNIRKRQWLLLAFNVSNEIIAGLAAYLVLTFTNFNIDSSILLIMGKVFLATCMFEVVNYSILAVDSAIRGESWRELLYSLRKSLIEVLPLAMFSGLLGKFYFDFGPIMLVMFAVPVFFGRELHASYARMADAQRSTLETLTRTLEAKDKYTAGHVERVAKFAKYIGEELGYSPKHLERIRQAALLHDAGKLIVPSALLNKPGKLTEEEFKVIQRHEFVTIEILSMIDFLAPIAFLAGGDHNSMEGKSTKNLDPFIVSACDAFDAMTSSRSYRKALSMEIAFEELNKKGGKQFHPKVVEALIKAIEARGEHYGDGYETNIVHEDAPQAGIGSAGIGDLESNVLEPSNDIAQKIPQEAESDAMAANREAVASAQHPVPSIKRSSIIGINPGDLYQSEELEKDKIAAQNDGVDQS